MINKKLAKLIEQGRNVMLSGAAGTGKSFQVREIIKKYGDDYNIALTSTTGIAATNIGGQTLHSFLNLGMIRTKEKQRELSRILYNPWARWEEVKKTDILIIDEISMCDGFLFNLIEEVCRNIRSNTQPFGGIQVILVGDCYQLPPVEAATSGFFFNSDAFAFGNFKPLLLTKIYRQNDAKFIEVLNRIRLAEHSVPDIEYLQERQFPALNYALLDTTCLYPTNNEADLLNKYRLDNLEGELIEIHAQDTDYAKIEEEKNKQSNIFLNTYKKDYSKNLRCPAKLQLKPGARVILLNNLDVGRGLCNGSIGHFKEKKGDLLICEFNGIEEMINKAKFEVYEKGSVVFEREQYPLALGWAISIHKSQGMSLDSVAIDFSKIFAPHQAYVALSRAKTYEGLYLKNLRFNSVFIDENVVDFMNSLQGKKVKNG